MIDDSTASDELRERMLEIATEGKLQGCFDAAVGVATNPEANEGLQCEALRACAAISDGRAWSALSGLSSHATVPGDVAGVFVEVFADHMTAANIVSIIDRVPTMPTNTFRTIHSALARGRVGLVEVVESLQEAADQLVREEAASALRVVAINFHDTPKVARGRPTSPKK